MNSGQVGADVFRLWGQRAGCARTVVSKKALGLQECHRSLVPRDPALVVFLRVLCVFLCALPVFLWGPPAMADSYPDRPIRLIVPFAAGTVTDQTGRYIGQKMTIALGQNVIVDNRPGANGVIGAQAAATATADGYTIVIGTSSTNAANVSLYKKLPYDAMNDFAPISKLVIGGQVLVVNPALGVKSVQELLSLARAKPGQLTFGWGNSTSQVGMAHFKALAAIEMTGVPYKGIPAALNDILGGRIDMAIGDSVTVMPLVKSNRLRALAITTPKRISVFPDLPTVAEQGLPGYEIAGWLSLYAPAKTPVPTINKLNTVVVQALSTPEAAEFFGRSGWDVVPSTPGELGAYTRQEIQRWSRLIQSAGIVPE